MRRIALLVFASLGVGLLACGRHVVLDPLEAVRSNDPNWNIQREPNPDGGGAPAAATPTRN